MIFNPIFGENLQCVRKMGVTKHPKWGFSTKKEKFSLFCVKNFSFYCVWSARKGDFKDRNKPNI